MGRSVIKELSADWGHYSKSSHCSVFKTEWQKRFNPFVEMPFFHYEFRDIEIDKISIAIHIEAWGFEDLRIPFRDGLKKTGFAKINGVDLSKNEVFVKTVVSDIDDIDDAVEKGKNAMVNLIRETWKYIDAVSKHVYEQKKAKDFKDAETDVSDNLFKLETRRELYNIIFNYPGLHLRELARRTDFSFGAVRHHLKYLKTRGLIVTRSEGGYTRYYAARKIGKMDKEFLNILRQKVPRKIILLLLLHNDPRFYSMRELNILTRIWGKPFDSLFKLDKHQTTLDFHLKKLVDMDIVERKRVGKEIKYRIKNEYTIFNYLLTYKKALSNDLVDFTLYWSNWGISKRVDACIEKVYEIFPHPYHV